MRCPTLGELPPPPPGKTGWPWTEASPQLPDTMPDGSPWPRVSIVTPSYNQAQFLEETIRSVLLQGYRDLEYIIIDGGSSDGSVEIIRKYEPWLAYWVSEPDRGQAHAINKGWERCTGEVLAWLNSDDTYVPGAVSLAAAALAAHPEAGMVYGQCNMVGENGRILGCKKAGPLNVRRLLVACYLGQPAVLLRRPCLESIGWVNESLHYAMDWELWIRVARVFMGVYLPVPLANARQWPEAKTQRAADAVLAERDAVIEGVFTDPSLPAALHSARADSIAFSYLLRARRRFGHKQVLVAMGCWLRALLASPRYSASQMWRYDWPVLVWATARRRILRVLCAIRARRCRV